MQEYIITSIKEVLRIHFNRAVELKVSPEPVSLMSDMHAGSRRVWVRALGSVFEFSLLLLSRHTVSSASLLTAPPPLCVGECVCSLGMTRLPDQRQHSLGRPYQSYCPCYFNEMTWAYVRFQSVSICVFLYIPGD